MNTRPILLAMALAIALVVGTAARAVPVAYDWQFDLTVDQVTPHDYIDSFAVGQAWMHYDAIADHLDIFVTWTDLVGEIDRIHIHGAALPGFNERSHVVDVLMDPATLPAGTGLHTGQFQTVKHLFEAADGHGGAHGGNYTAEEALAILVSEEAYMLIHSTTYFEGELRGQLALIPEPATGVSVGLGLVVIAASGRGRVRPTSSGQAPRPVGSSSA